MKRHFINHLYNVCMSKIHPILHRLDKIILDSGEHLEGNSFYRDGEITLADEFETKRKNLFYYGCNAETILEVGFNGGHSCLLFLMANPYSKIHILDIGSHSYSRSCFRFLDAIFPSRLSVDWGDSRDTFSKVTDTYDFIHVDGGHGVDCLISDVRNALRCTSRIIIDDISFHPEHMIQDLNAFVIDLLGTSNILQEIMPYYSLFHICIKRIRLT